MPFYTYINKETKEVFPTDFGIQTISEMEQFLVDHPELDTAVSGAKIIFSDMWRMGLKKPSNGFRDILKKIKGKHRGSSINTW
jgi:hypothetical protein